MMLTPAIEQFDTALVAVVTVRPYRYVIALFNSVYITPDGTKFTPGQIVKRSGVI